MNADNGILHGNESLHGGDNWSTKFATISSLDSNGNWNTTGSGDASSSGGATDTYSGSMSFNRTISSTPLFLYYGNDLYPDQGVIYRHPLTEQGTLTEDGGETDTYNFAVHSVLNADGSYTDTGTGTADQATHAHSKLWESGTGSSRHIGPWQGGQLDTLTYTASASFGDQSESRSSSDQKTNWVLDPGDTWRAATITFKQGSNNNPKRQHGKHQLRLQP